MAPDLFARPPRELVDYFKGRPSVETGRWKEMLPHQHALAFTVARTSGYDVIDDIRKAVQRAVLDRAPFDQFQKELTPILQAKGWWGKAKDGKTQLGSPARLQTIYWSNVRSAHAAGEWARTQAAKDVLPYLVYKISLAENKRPEHIAWVGTTLPVDHLWWRTHYPPNGWRCQCRVEQISEARAEAMPAHKREAPKGRVEMIRDKRTGAVWRVPEGIDPGWQRNPGYTRSRIADYELRRAMRAAERPDAAPAIKDEARRAITARLRQGPEFKAVVDRNLGYDPRRYAAEPAMRDLAEYPVAIAAAPTALVAEAGERFGIAIRDALVRFKVAISEKQAKHHPGLAASDYAQAQAVLDSAAEARFSRTAAGEAIIEMLAGDDGAEWLLALRAEEEGFVLLSLYQPTERTKAAYREARRKLDRERKKA